MAAALLVSLCAALLWPCARWLERPSMARRAPGAVAIGWIGLGANAAIATVVAGITIAPWRGRGAGSVGFEAVGRWNALNVIGVSIVGDAVVVLGVLVAITSLRLRHERRELRELVDLVGDAAAGVVVVPSEVLSAYYLPGRGGRIVLSEGLCECASQREIDAIVAHETAHGRGRHAWLLFPFSALKATAAAIPWVTCGERSIRRIVEYLADDVAVGRVGIAATREALERFTTSSSPSSTCALHADGTAVEDRLDRLGSVAPWWAVPLATLLVAACGASIAAIAT